MVCDCERVSLRAARRAPRGSAPTPHPPLRTGVWLSPWHVPYTSTANPIRPPHSSPIGLRGRWQVVYEIDVVPRKHT